MRKDVLAYLPNEELPTDLSRCRSCGKPEVELLDAWVCKVCAAEARARGFVWEPYAPSPSDPPVESKFAELFRAARVLLNEEAPEEQVFPTLAFAGYGLSQSVKERISEKARLVKAWGKPKAWEAEVEKFVSRFPGARPVRVEDDVLILQQEPVSIQVVRYPQTDIPRMVEIHVYHRRTRTEAEEIAHRYEQKLSSAGIACDVVDRMLPISADPFEWHVIITVPNHKVADDVPPSNAAEFRSERPRFPHPEHVRAYCELAIGHKHKGSNGFAKDLGMRGGKGAESNKWLVPASVLIYLQDIAEIKDNEKIYRLLNEYVYGEKRFLGNDSDPTRGVRSTLADYVEKWPDRVRKPLYAAERRFDYAG